MPLGLYVDPKPGERCARNWHNTGPIDCAITIDVGRDPLLVEKFGTQALSNRGERTVLIDARLTDRDRLRVAAAHEIGHIILDTPRHTQGGIMGGSAWVMRPVDFALACETIGVCR